MPTAGRLSLLRRRCPGPEADRRGLVTEGALPPPPPPPAARATHIGLKAGSAYGGGIQSIRTDQCSLSLSARATPLSEEQEVLFPQLLDPCPGGVLARRASFF